MGLLTVGGWWLMGLLTVGGCVDGAVDCWWVCCRRKRTLERKKRDLASQHSHTLQHHANLSNDGFDIDDLRSNSPCIELDDS